jgi:E3 ubiquitin-protein ligase HUWE1
LDFILKSEDPDLESALYQPFTVEIDAFGGTTVHELLPEGAELFVNQENKCEYVELLLDFIFNVSCEEQFKAFKRGFYKTISENVIELFQPEELE